MNYKFSQEEIDQYEKKYQEGYGLKYPESHVMRTYRRVIEPVLPRGEGKKIFDFSCGIGGNLKFFVNEGFAPYGCDTSKTAIKKSKEIFSYHQNNFFVINGQESLATMAPENSFDIFLANQVLYYLDDENIKRVVDDAYKMIKPGGFFVVSMIGKNTGIYDNSKRKIGDFYECEINYQRYQQKTYINFKDKDDLVGLFSPFKKLYIGSYDFSLIPEEGNDFHWLYVGIKD